MSEKPPVGRVIIAFDPSEATPISVLIDGLPPAMALGLLEIVKERLLRDFTRDRPTGVVVPFLGGHPPN